ncbi:MAG: Na+/H+ antiporter subunit E [Aestuariivirga sp.]|uniref:Na+/H+ antiporter subunit E n=1 Tax=Aestuariivirga sp. TaxID=2650926 RepID=UPI0025B87AD5|nr:Na+/H+ antiporter subunit E [Aestuariivirga sp.]MCA3561463.1 Na+/H+ antiporter subunit E [Aestuariivirga sp.]
MPGAVTREPGTATALLLRAAAYFVFWVALAGTGLKDLAAGLVTAVIAAWISLQLVPAGELAVKPGRALALFVRFLWQSVVAGVTVARIALMPNMPLKPGVVEYRSKLPPGNRRFLFMTYASLLPGTLPTGTDDTNRIEVHALDTGQPVAAQLAAEEARIANVLADRAAQ